MVKRFRSMTYPYIAWIIAIIVVPMLLIVLYAFTTSGNSVLTFQFTFAVSYTHLTLPTKA